MNEAKLAARKVGWAVAGASAAVLLLVALVASAYVVRISRFDPRDNPRRHKGPPRPWQERIVDVGDLLPVLIVVSLIGVTLLGVLAWYVARQSTKPLEEALRTQRAFVADASHELRTPLTTLNSRIQLAKRRIEKGGDATETLDQALQDSKVMNEVLTDLLVAAETEASDPNAQANVDEAVQTATATVAAKAEQANATISYTPDPTVTAKISPVALTRAIVILLDNALAHSPAGSVVTVTAEQKEKRTLIRVTDEGTGIDAGSQLFDRFQRGSSEQARGFGLGLALVRDVADRFEGSVTVESTGPTGTTFLLDLLRI